MKPYLIKVSITSCGSKSLACIPLISEIAQRITGIKPKKTNLPLRSGETKEFSSKLGKIKTQLGYRPSWILERGVKQIIENIHPHEPPSYNKECDSQFM